ncbi:MAG: hypothetical protein ACRDV9_03125 [Acidimicrobiia bacterium]
MKPPFPTAPSFGAMARTSSLFDISLFDISLFDISDSGSVVIEK